MSLVAAIQMNSSAVIGHNLIAASTLIKRAVAEGAQLIVLPEAFSHIGSEASEAVGIAEDFGHGRVQDWVAKQADENKVWIVAGTIPLQEMGQSKLRAACIVYDDDGQERARYDKIHLFDHHFSDSLISYHESAHYSPGKDLVVVDTPVGKLGLTVCYDLRFPELYRALREQGAEIFIAPSAFLQSTGRYHWDALIKARAIENQCFVVAANQCGQHEGGRQTYGHSMIVGPWGLVLDSVGIQAGYAIADIDLVRLQILREEFPVWDHRQL